MSAQDKLEIARFVQAVNDQIKAHIGNGHTMAFGTIVTTSPLTVRIDGSTTPAPANRDASYAPSIGDRVYVHIVRNQNVIGGKVV